jgi:hypothetical protein
MPVYKGQLTAAATKSWRLRRWSKSRLHPAGGCLSARPVLRFSRGVTRWSGRVFSGLTVVCFRMSIGWIRRLLGAGTSSLAARLGSRSIVTLSWPFLLQDARGPQGKQERRGQPAHVPPTHRSLPIGTVVTPTPTRPDRPLWPGNTSAHLFPT